MYRMRIVGVVWVALFALVVEGWELPRFIPREYLNDEFFMMNRAVKAPQIDGELSDECWKEAVELCPFSTLGGGGSLAQLQTKVKLTWDTEGFYIAYHCEQPDMMLAGIRGDGLEIFFLPMYSNKPYHINNATSLTALAHWKPEDFHYQHIWGRMDGTGDVYFKKNSGVLSAGKRGRDYWNWEAKVPFKALAVRGLGPPDSRIRYWKIGCNRFSSFHGEISWYASLISSLNHQANHCPLFQLVGSGFSPIVRLMHPLKGKKPGSSPSLCGIWARR